MVGLCTRGGVVVMKAWDTFRLYAFLTAWVAMWGFLFVFFYDIAQADPPNPKTHYKFEAWPNGTIVLHFQMDGYKQKFMYQQLLPTQPANNCINKYYTAHMELITFSQSTLPSWYIADLRPFMKWMPIEKEWVRLE